MKKLSIALVIGLILVLAISSIGMAALPGTGWWTAYRVQNIGSGSGTITMQAYDKDSASVYGSSNFTFAQYNALVYNPGVAPDYPTGNIIGFTSALPAGFIGSVVLSSSVPAASVVEIGNYTNGTLGGGGTASGQYQGAGSSAVNTTLLIPVIKHNYGTPGQTTTLYVQAAGADASATITYTMNDGSVHTQSATIPANKMYIFDPANATPAVASSGCGTVVNVSPCFGSAKIISTTGAMAGVVVEHPHTGSPAAFVLSTRMATPNDQGTILYAASMKNEYTTGSGTGRVGITIMNVGTAQANVRITLTVTAKGSNAPGTVNIGDVFTQDVVIDPNTSTVFSQWDGNLGGLPAGTFASAKFESLDDATYNPQPLVGIANDAKLMSTIPGGRGKTAANAYSAATATTKVAGPMVKVYLGTRNGGATIQNVGDQPTTIYIEYYQYATGTKYAFHTTATVPAGGAIDTNGISANGATKFTIDGGSWAWADLAGKEFSVIAYTTNSQPLVLLGSENTPNGSMDMSNYEGINY